MANVGKVNTTSIDITRQELVSAIILDNFTEIGKIVPLVDDVSALVGPGMKSIAFNKVEDFDLQKQTYPVTVPGATADGTVDPNGTPIVCQNLTITQDVLELNCKAVAGFSYDPCDITQSVLGVESVVLQKASEAITRQVERDLITALEADVDPANILAPIGGAGTISEGDLICLHTALNARNIPETERCLVVHPNDLKDIHALKCIKDANVTGDATSTFRTGVVGMIMGSPVIWTTLATPGTLTLLHKSSLKFATQTGVMVLESDMPKLACKEVSLCMGYGFRTICEGIRTAKLVR